jgi:8-oxo-dGTP pyrophosphatase MutT (NUDIX family)
MKKEHKHVLHQSGVLPFKNEDGTIHILLITTTGKKQWIIPKGNIEKKLTPRESALKEAVEEAGIKGTVTGESIGSYRSRKKKTGRVCSVEVFLMKVEQEMEDWQEKGKRKRRWCTIEEAAAKVTNVELRELILNAADFIHHISRFILFRGAP